MVSEGGDTKRLEASTFELEFDRGVGSKFVEQHHHEAAPEIVKGAGLEHSDERVDLGAPRVVMGRHRRLTLGSASFFYYLFNNLKLYLEQYSLCCIARFNVASCRWPSVHQNDTALR